MRLRPALVFLFRAALITPGLFAQTPVAGSEPQLDAVPVPFVGCASYGQVELRNAPKGITKSVPISPRDADALAYYLSADGIGVLAPRGWYCQGVSDSGGHTLFLSPKPILYTRPGWGGLKGSAIEIDYISSENSGRYDMAEMVARVFPCCRAFVARVWDLDVPLPSSPFPNDTLKYRSRSSVEYQTPARTDGLGTFRSQLKRNGDPIVGAAILVGDSLNPSGAVILSSRMPRDLATLAPAIIRYAESEVATADPK